PSSWLRRSKEAARLMILARRAKPPLPPIYRERGAGRAVLAGGNMRSISKGSKTDNSSSLLLALLLTLTLHRAPKRTGYHVCKERALGSASEGSPREQTKPGRLFAEALSAISANANRRSRLPYYGYLAAEQSSSQHHRQSRLTLARSARTRLLLRIQY